MGGTALVAVGLAAAAALAVVVLAVSLVRERHRTRVLLEDRRSESEQLRRRLDELSGPLAGRPAAPAEFVITDLGRPRPDPDDHGPHAGGAVSSRLVLDAAVGESLVKAAALGHGLRRALSPESRNRIRFAMRREVRRARKQRRQEMREAWRRVRAEDHAA